MAVSYTATCAYQQDATVTDQLGLDSRAYALLPQTF